MIAKEVDYQWHYDEFVRRHGSGGLSLKRIYSDAAKSADPSKTTVETTVQSTGFQPLIITPPVAEAEDGPNPGIVRITLPNGVGIEIGQCSVNDLMVLTGGPLSGCHV